MGLRQEILVHAALIAGLGLPGILPVGQAAASSVDVCHADSLAGPMKALKKAFPSVDRVPSDAGRTP